MPTTDERARDRDILARLEKLAPEAHVATIDALLATNDSEQAGGDPLPVPCGSEECDEVLIGRDAWCAHQDEHRAAS